MSGLSSDMCVALSRFGLGAKNALAYPNDPRNILHDEIDRGPAKVSSDLNIRDTPTLLADLLDLKEQLKNGVATPARSNRLTDQLLQEVEARYNGTYREPIIGLNERMVMFWTNHFSVQTSKSGPLKMTAGAYEREAIRPHVFGRFTDLVMSVETHPCMLNYLDNVSSVGPDSPGGEGRKGINENLAREIMELHVLGVNSGYSQADVTAFAKALTGWTINRNPNDNRQPYGSFTFAEQFHEPGSEVVLGRTYGDTGFFQAADVLVDLCARPAAARFISTKLVRHFVADNPPAPLVEKLSGVFLDTGGDLGEVSHALVESEEAWAAPATKLRMPQEYYAAMLRALATQPPAQLIYQHLAAMGQKQWDPSGPNGFSDTFDTWATPAGLSSRVQVAQDIAASTDGTIDPRNLAESLFGVGLTSATRGAISRADTSEQGIGLVLLSPEFLRR